MTTYYTKQGRRYVPADLQPVPADPKPNYDDVGKGPWREGPPPSVGWWPASFDDVRKIVRWWNGTHWSWCATGKDSMSHVAMVSVVKETSPLPIRWRDRADWWPERSRT